MSHKILLVNGPNLNLLGRREPSVYGHQTLADIVAELNQQAKLAEVELEHIQSNAEFELINAIHATDAQMIIINPAAFTHTSVALRDALLGVAIPFFEVHLSNVHAREAFRHHSYFSDKAIGVICGFGSQGYEFALAAAIKRLNQPQ
ncbi:type II 3-dehydroquinate dehydratase [Shewanella baltica]|jgi:3-dehydroquinate dehydratase-2|uniref:3-dehydroquinate dehydratase n=2 Tax=Shewanella TaxID=22 RepID=AROQ_SHEB2|nr:MULTISPECIES: type II 3-dehydroquinate dehydratase [Shewanella]B8ECJ0.1 RecName: Full=3-dehydroquinate dehydratase; Short=3-dehydroquinase; AltName: Full=Type II DHQase [Shewanella baltica OS223]ACK48275.1 3-dehydroquinate dehydratase, type II [Shewanella baltica OS223]EHC08197.1 3-dehydroquinate dehydratase, type II [Shewanella baltica OS625]MCB2380832.1 type II 3-dehydroquinate dehydratase [Shewanella sp. SR1]MCS6098223.1 type II 3-dehydroquinate dehydratase [Shewanella baltica]MCS611805